MKMAETRRAFVFNEGWNTLGAIGAGAYLEDTFVANAFGYLNQGYADYQFAGNQITDPLLVFKLGIQINWPGLVAQVPTATPTVRVDVYLVAMNDQLPNTIAPRITSPSEDTIIWMKGPDYASQSNWCHTINGQTVRVIKRKTVVMGIPNQVGFVQTKTVKVTKRLRGHKTYETTFAGDGSEVQTTYLRGWNFYWVVAMVPNVVTGSVAVTGNPIRLVGDRYVYFKDF